MGCARRAREQVLGRDTMVRPCTQEFPDQPRTADGEPDGGGEAAESCGRMVVEAAESVPDGLVDLPPTYSLPSSHSSTRVTSAVPRSRARSYATPHTTQQF